MSAEITTYKAKNGKEYPVLKVNAGFWSGGKPRSYYFGMAKCKAILENLETVKDFVESNSNGKKV